MSEAQTLRRSILAAPLETSGEEPSSETLYIPLSHQRALRLDTHIVVGARGMGKSFWTAALQSESLRALLGPAVPELNDVVVHVGFAHNQAIDSYPNADVFESFMDQGGDPYDLWRAVVLRWMASRMSQVIPSDSWTETVAWLKNKPEDAARLMERPRNWRGLILFDALDRTSNNWQRMDDIVRGLLRAVLWMKSYSGLYGKVFLREDQAERTVFNFPYAFKLTATKAELTWARHDLYGLLWQRLINAPGEYGKTMRKICTAEQREGVWLVADDMKRESESQHKAFERLAGTWMDRDRRRGVPYTWLVGHLADGRGQTSPRSFLAAIRQAAEDSMERYPDHKYALHYESIKRGIQKASEIRVAEMAEDYPWVPEVLSVLRGMNVPCYYDEILSRWQNAFPAGPQDIYSERLPAQHAYRGWEGIREDLRRLGLLEIRKDGRIDMPAIYRVGFGLGRMGGMRREISEAARTHRLEQDCACGVY